MDDSRLREIPFHKETIYEGSILHVEKWQVTCPNGHSAPREIVVHKGAAAVVPVYEDGTTLLVRQHRVSVDRVTLEIPAGKLDRADEDPLDCAVRELEEETGLKAEAMTLLTSVLTTPGFCTEKIAIYLAQGLSQLREPCYLETQSPQNVPFYESYGFREVFRTPVPGTDMNHWGMLWEP